MTIKVYTSGPMQHTPDEGRSWRQEIQEAYPEIEWLNPLDKAIEEEKPDDPQYDENEALSQRLMDGDKEMIDEADAMLLVRTDTASHGAGREHEYAVANDIPVFVYNEVDDPSPCLVADTEVVYDSLDAVVLAIERELGIEGVV